ncbi:MAG: chromosome segregation protein ScpA [Methanomassiliicoccus sp.]|nr:chromosome segregation protein ScpA [Methanomassiliicoccus sp.]
MIADQAAEGVLSHLLFHKAMIDEDAGAEKIDRYLNVLGEAAGASSARDPLDRSIETVFELVLSNDLDPWDIDLMRFTKLYTEKVKEEEVNFVLAGKLMLMAWSILRMQSEQVLTNSEPRNDEFLDDLGEVEFTSEEPRMVYRMPEDIELDEVVRHRGSRPVTLLELLDAFEEAQREEERNVVRERIRAVNRAKLEGVFDTKAHNDDLERDVEDVWQRIVKCGSGPVDIQDIWNGGRDDLVTAFVSLLFLARHGRISVWQDDLPYGTVKLEVRLDWDIGTLEDAPPMPAPQARPSNMEPVM